jgi:hypothetical protein
MMPLQMQRSIMLRKCKKWHRFPGPLSMRLLGRNIIDLFQLGAYYLT